MARSNVVKTQYDAGSLTIEDGSGTPLTLVLRFDNGDFSLGELGPTSTKVVKTYQARGSVTSFRYAERQGVPISISLQLAEFVDTAVGTIIDFMSADAGSQFAARVSTTSTGDVPTFDLRFVMEGTTYGDASDHSILLKDCIVKFALAEGDPNKLTISGECWGGIDFLNGAHSVSYA